MTDYDWPRIEARREEGATWPEIAPSYGVTADTMRKAYSRYLGNAADAPETAGLGRPIRTDGMKILGIDIETAPNVVYTWGLWRQDIHLDQIVQSGRPICFSARWFSDGGNAQTIFVSEHLSGNKAMCLAAHALLDEADAVVHYNGKKFDIPTLNKAFVLYNLRPPSPYKEVDLLSTARKKFRFASNKLDYLLKQLDLGEKIRHEGFLLWVKCMNGDEAAWERMEEYNKGDVDQLEKLYRRLLPWISNHPNHALYQDAATPTCTNCGSENVQWRGYSRTKTQMYHRAQCRDCGTWLRERYNSTPKDRQRQILTQAK